MTVLDERAHADVLKPLLAAELGTDPDGTERLYNYGEVPGADGVPGTLPKIYALLTIERRVAPAVRVGRASHTGWRVSVRYVARTVDDARWAAMKVAGALNEITIEVDGIESTPLTHESEAAIAPDSTFLSGLLQYTYAL